VYMSPTITFSADDDVQFIGNVSYPIASLVWNILFLANDVNGFN
jgi:hypothetical protein